MSISNKDLANRLLGYLVDAHLLIINADGFGMCHAVNEAIFRIRYTTFKEHTKEIYFEQIRF